MGAIAPLAWREGKQRQHPGLAGQSHDHRMAHNKSEHLRLGRQRAQQTISNAWNIWFSDPPKLPSPIGQLRQQPYAGKILSPGPTGLKAFYADIPPGQWVDTGPAESALCVLKKQKQ